MTIEGTAKQAINAIQELFGSVGTVWQDLAKDWHNQPKNTIPQSGTVGATPLQPKQRLNRRRRIIGKRTGKNVTYEVSED